MMNTRPFLACGILSSLLYIAMNIFVPMLDENYHSLSQTVSELSAIGAPTRAVWVWLGYLYTILFGAFAYGVVESAEGNTRLKTTGILLLAYTFVSLFWPLAPMHLREALAAGEKSLSDTLHLVLAGVTVILMVAAMSFGAAALRKSFRIYSIVTIFLLLLFGILTGIDAPNVERNLPTPCVGVWERINIGVFLLWVIVLALRLSVKRPTTVPYE